MEYTILQLARLSGVTPRTLRYYDQIGLLSPQRGAQSGYRLYGEREVLKLQQILLYRELEIPLKQIARLLQVPGFDPTEALRAQRAALLKRRERLDQLIHTIDRTVESLNGGTPMQDSEKFEGLKRQLVADNERTYGQEARSRYGDEAVDRANARVLGLAPDEYQLIHQQEEEAMALLRQAMAQGNPTGALAREAVAKHHQWLSHFGAYSAQAYRQLGQMYSGDPRFAQYYQEKAGPGAAQFLCQAIERFAGEL